MQTGTPIHTCELFRTSCFYMLYITNIWYPEVEFLMPSPYLHLLQDVEVNMSCSQLQFSLTVTVAKLVQNLSRYYVFK